MYKTPQLRTTFGSWDVEKVHAVVARSTFPSQNVQNTPWSDHFWKLRCGKSARRCGAKHISKSKVLKTGGLGPLLEVEMSKKCTPLWREAHFQVKMYKAQGVRTTFGSPDVEKVWREAHFEVKSAKNWRSRTTFGSWDVKKVHAVVARSTFPSQNVQNTRGSDHFWKSRCWKSARRCGAKHILKSKVLKSGGLGPLLEVAMSKKCTPLWREAHFQVKMLKTLGVRSTFGGSDVPSLRFTTLHYIRLHYTTFHYTSLHYTTLHYTTTTSTTTTTQLHSTTLHYTPLHSITLHYTTLHYTTLHYTTLRYTTLHNTTTTTTQLHSTTLRYTRLHYTTLHYTTLHYTTLPSTTLHYTKLHYTTLHCTTLHSTTLHYTTLHYTTLHWMTLHHRQTGRQIDR